MKELKFVEYLKRKTGKPVKGVKLGIGDDCAVLEAGKDKYILWASDMLVSGTHFIPGKDPYKKVGRKACAVNISDIAAMGGVPKYITVSLGVPPKLNDAALKDIYEGMLAICKEYNVQIVGGDTVRSENLVIDVSIIGEVKKKELVLRSGVKSGDVIMVTGPIRDGKKTHLDFDPRLTESQYLGKNFKINSMIDVSDGLAMDLTRICKESKRGARLDPSMIPLSSGLSLKDAMHYGESFELLFTMSPKEADKLLRATKGVKFKNSFHRIGKIPQNCKKILQIDPKKGQIPINPQGFNHM